MPGPCYRAGREAIFYSPPEGERPQGRFDAPAREYGVCYLAEGPHIAFAETFLRQNGISVVSETDLGARSLARIEVTRDLKLVQLHGSGLARLAATSAVSSGPYPIARAWSLALHGHRSSPDGIAFRARHDDSGIAIALFDRAHGAVRCQDTFRLTDAAYRGELAALLERYGLAWV